MILQPTAGRAGAKRPEQTQEFDPSSLCTSSASAISSTSSSPMPSLLRCHCDHGNGDYVMTAFDIDGGRAHGVAVDEVLVDDGLFC